MMVKRVTFPLHCGDYRRDTPHLSTIEHGAYLLLCMYYYEHDGLPADDNDIRKITGLRPEQWRKYRPTLQRFFVNGWHHKRLDADIARANEIRERRQEAIGNRWNSGDHRSSSGDPRSSANSLKNNNPPHTNAYTTDSVDNYPEPGSSSEDRATPLTPLKSLEAGEAFVLPPLPFKKESKNLSSEVKTRARGTFWAPLDTPQYAAWQQFRASQGQHTPIDKRGGWYFPTEWPPTQTGGKA